MGHLDTQRSLPAIGAEGKSGLCVLAKKLRLLEDHHLALLNAPDGFASRLQPGPRHVHTAADPAGADDAVLLFVRNVEELRRLGAAAIHSVKPNGLLWIAYPKGGETKGVTDLPATPWWVQRDVVGEITSVSGYRPVAFVAIDETYTAMRFKQV